MPYTLEDVGIKLLPEFECYRQKIEATIKPCVRFESKLSKDHELTRWQSKRGGLPYLPKSTEYPTDKDGKFMDFVAQINWAEVPHLDGFPEKGILTLYVSQNWNEPCKYEECRGIYFREVDKKVVNLITDFSFLPDSYFGVFSISSYDYVDAFTNFYETIEPINEEDYRYENFLKEAYLHEIITSDYQGLWGYGNKIGGYPRSYQGVDNIRRYYNTEGEEPYELLLQVYDEALCVDFFIKESALRQLNFSDLLFYVDSD